MHAENGCGPDRKTVSVHGRAGVGHVALGGSESIRGVVEGMQKGRVPGPVIVCILYHALD